jgi:hypothetical protein
MTALASSSRQPAKPLAGGIFVVFWIVAIAAWIVGAHLADPASRGFVIDIGIVFACVGFAAPALPTMRSLVSAMLLGLVAIGLFAIGSYAHVTVLLYLLRMLGPFLALLAPLNRTVGSIRVFS